MKSTRMLVIALLALALPACHSKKHQEEQEFIPPGYYETRAEAQDFANRANADLSKTRAEERAAGVKPQDMPCGQYRLVTTHNTEGKVFWGARMDTTGCQGTRAPHSTPSTTGGRKP